MTKVPVVKLLLLSVAAAFVGACASDQIIIDPKGVDMERFEKDLAECKELSEQVETGQEVGKSAVLGALIVGGIAAAGGDDVGGAALRGGAGGAALGASGAQGRKVSVLRKCVSNRGYVILN